MNILGIGMGELLLIGVIAIMVVGPERMVEFSRMAGRLLGKLRRETDGITKEFREAISTFDEVTQVANEAKAALNEVTSEVNQTAATVQQAAKEVQRSVVDAQVAATGSAVAGRSAVPTTALKPPAPPKPQPSVNALLDRETAVATPPVARAQLPTDEATEVGLAEMVPENPADVEPIEIRQPTLMIEELAIQEPEVDTEPEPTPESEPAALSTKTQPNAAEGASEESQG